MRDLLSDLLPAREQPFTWKPTDVIEVTNVSDENILLDLYSGLLRLDAGRKVRLTASALAQHEVLALARVGKLKVETYRRK
jgi:hypothetical protein